MNFRTYDDLTKCILKNLYKVPRDIDLIVGIPRSGTMAANILALYLNLPFTSIFSLSSDEKVRTGSTRKCKEWIGYISDAKHILIVDDSVSSGKAIVEAKQFLVDNKIQSKVTFLAVYALAVSIHHVDIYFEICEQPRMFEWNFMHHWALEYCCMDIDGVVCDDPSRQQNDDGERYLDFLKNATPKFIPTQKVGRFVTTRLEKYRSETEQWLREHEINYDELIMLEGMTARERALSDTHASFKAEIYQKCDAILFIESDYTQALEICHLSGKPVLCIENMQYITSENVIAKLKVHNREFKVTAKRVIKKLLGKINYVE